jgi:hypothetical protein
MEKARENPPRLARYFTGNTFKRRFKRTWRAEISKFEVIRNEEAFFVVRLLFRLHIK